MLFMFFKCCLCFCLNIWFFSCLGIVVQIFCLMIFVCVLYDCFHGCFFLSFSMFFLFRWSAVCYGISMFFPQKVFLSLFPLF